MKQVNVDPENQQLTREDILIFLLVVILVTIPIGYWVSSRWQNSVKAHTEAKERLIRQSRGAFIEPTADQFNKAREQQLSETRFLGQTVILQTQSGNLERATFLLPDSIRPASVESIATVCWVEYRDSQQWRGAKGFDIFFVDHKTKQIWRVDHFEGFQNPAHERERTFDPIDNQEFWPIDRMIKDKVVASGQR